MKVEASAPSNIALIKYMGKTSKDGNLPSNSSLSYTLEHLRSFVILEPAVGEDAWEALPGFAPLELSPTGRKKFLDHFQRLKLHWKISGSFLIRSANNFPADCGLASSASSFAALTTATWELAKRQGHSPTEDALSLSKLSRLGSGSSCRSFFAPWALWRGAGAEKAGLDLHLEHAVVIAGAAKKAVSSSEAHLRVVTSLLFQGRVERAEKRLQELTAALNCGDWKAAQELCWNEFWDMHALFETSRPSFGYMNEQTLKILDACKNIWLESGDGPLVTMDAGANVHLLVRPEQIPECDRWLNGFSAIKSWS